MMALGERRLVQIAGLRWLILRKSRQMHCSCNTPAGKLVLHQRLMSQLAAVVAPALCTDAKAETKRLEWFHSPSQMSHTIRLEAQLHMQGNVNSKV